MTPAAPRKSLSTRVFAALFAVALFAFAVATAAVVSMSWTVYETDAEERLSSQLEGTAREIAQQPVPQMIEGLAATKLSETRITLVAGDGTVLFDSVVDPRTMANHGSRAEIVAARSGNDRVVLRKSETTGTDTLYAARLVDTQGTVLRLSETRTSLVYYLRNLLIPLALAALAAVALSALLARAITRRVTAPLLAVDLEAPLESGTYKEIDPLLARIDAQRSELMSQNAQLEQAVAMRREFTGNVSHEMKSPLQVIGGYAELIENGVTSPEDTRRFAGLIGSEARAMRTLIDDVLVLSRLDEMQMDSSMEFDLAAACGSAVARLSSVAESRSIHLTLQAPHAALVRGSASLAEQMVYNLVDNALRYGRDGGVVEVSLEVSAGEAVVVVSDDGPGVPVEARERIFERFYRVDASRSRETGGTGLGLAIVKHAALSLGGSVQAGESHLGGLAVTVRLPLAQ